VSRVSLSHVDKLARLHLSTGVRVVAAPSDLWELIDLCGLRDVLGADAVREPKFGRHAGHGGVVRVPAKQDESLR
jgi:hypothetical protein